MAASFFKISFHLRGFTCQFGRPHAFKNPGVWGRAPINIDYLNITTGHQDNRIVLLEIN